MIKEKSSYHHKDLRNALIEHGIELVNCEGIKSFSLRKAAAACGVSHAAPYSHFKNKEELLEAMRKHITDQFVFVLQTTISKFENSPDLLQEMGITYVSFFLENPAYFSFIYSQSGVKIDLTFTLSDEDNYMPFVIYKNAAFLVFEKYNFPKKKQEDAVISMWAFIHGITALATMDSVTYEDDWKMKVIDFMNVFQVVLLNKKEN